jgi:hypothetical protein
MVMGQHDSPLAEELAFFQEQKAKLLEHNNGQFALIKGRALYGTFTTFDEAYAAGVKLFGNQPMLIKQILAEEPSVQVPAFSFGLIRSQA